MHSFNNLKIVYLLIFGTILPGGALVTSGSVSDPATYRPVLAELTDRFSSSIIYVILILTAFGHSVCLILLSSHSQLLAYSIFHLLVIAMFIPPLLSHE